MLRAVTHKATLAARSALFGPIPSKRIALQSLTSSGCRTMSSGPVESDEDFDNRYVAYFNRQDIDGWEIRKGMNDLMKYDLIPEPKIIIAALKACRRLNDYSLTTRFIEAVKFKCRVNKEIFPYIMQEIKPTLDELGISTLEEMGYDKPELWLKSVFEFHGK